MRVKLRHRDNKYYLEFTSENRLEMGLLKKWHDLGPRWREGWRGPSYYGPEQKSDFKLTLKMDFVLPDGNKTSNCQEI